MILWFIKFNYIDKCIDILLLITLDGTQRALELGIHVEMGDDADVLLLTELTDGDSASLIGLQILSLRLGVTSLPAMGGIV